MRGGRILLYIIFFPNTEMKINISGFCPILMIFIFIFFPICRALIYGCEEISNPPQVPRCGCSFVTVNSNSDFLWGCFIRHQPGLPGGGWAGQASLSPISSDFCLQLSLQALVSLLLTVPTLLAPVLIWALLSSSMLSTEPLKHMEIHCCWTRLTREKTHVWIQAHLFLHNCQGCDLVSITNTLYWEALHPQFTLAVNAASWN